MPATASPPATLQPVHTEDLLKKFDTPGPRYTSYPTADRFADRFGPADAVRVLETRRQGSASAPLSLYVHIPFCESLCYYCACNKIIARHHERADAYLDALETELALVVESLSAGRPVSQLHFGGGSPTFLSDAELTRVMTAPGQRVPPDAGLRGVDRGRSAHRHARASGALPPARIQPPELRRAGLRSRGAEGRAPRAVLRDGCRLDGERARARLRLDQRRPHLRAAEADARELREDDRADRRVAAGPHRLYAYAHLPEGFKPQRRVADADLPGAPQRIAMLGDAISGFLARDYRYIGMDHFALPDDALAVAKREGRLHRNFQGYSTQPDCDLVALGVSAIGRIGAAYYQNAKTLPEYQEALAQRRLPVVRGYALTPDDELRRDVIMALMCQGRVEFGPIERNHGVSMRERFAAEFDTLREMAASGLVVLEDESIQVTASGWFLVRAIAMVFDRHLQQSREQRRFSRVV